MYVQYQTEYTYIQKVQVAEITDPSLEIFRQDIGLHNPKVPQ